MICLTKNDDVAGVLVEYLSGTLDSDRKVELERHAAECADCREMLAVWNTLDEWKAPEVSPDFDAKLYARIAQESRAPWWKRAFGDWWKPALPVAAGCAVLALALMIRDPDVGVTPEPQTKARIESVNIEQVEQALEDMDLLAPTAKERL